ncbi:MAG TPA: hypothetical protein PKY82_24460 [Pyrinomonadaceae bacterium]|nr:hypothetical protein [Pyrinomonadaceae bacterium]
MKKNLIFVSIISLLFAFSSVSFGQKNKKSAPTQAGSEASTTTKKETTTQAAQNRTDINNWYSAKAFSYDALSILAKSNQFENDNTYRLALQKTTEAYTRLFCHTKGLSPCKDSYGQIEARNSGEMNDVRSSLMDSKESLRKASASSEKDAVMSLLDRSIELADTYITAHPAPQTSKENSSTNNTPPIDENTKVKTGTNPIANGTTNSKSSNSTQKNAITTQKNSTKKITSKPGSANGIEMTPCDVQGKSGNIADCGKVNEENTQRSTKTNRSKTKTTGPVADTSTKNTPKTTNFQTTSEDLQSVKGAKTQSGVNDPGDWSSKTNLKTTPKSSNTTSRKTKTNGAREGNELKKTKKKP